MTQNKQAKYYPAKLFKLIALAMGFSRYGLLTYDEETTVGYLVFQDDYPVEYHYEHHESVINPPGISK